jgi:hypothetical protein
MIGSRFSMAFGSCGAETVKLAASVDVMLSDVEA